jgi:ABC-type polysaccharide/polyol phosphate export permease
MVFLPFYMLVIGLLAVGLGWIFASIHVYLRDTAQFLSVILTFWFWLTPIFISDRVSPLNTGGCGSCSMPIRSPI